MSVLHFTLASCCEPEVGVITSYPALCVPPAFLLVLPVFFFHFICLFLNPSSSFSSRVTHAWFCTHRANPVIWTIWLILSTYVRLSTELLVLFFSVCSIPAFSLLFSFPYTSPCSLIMLTPILSACPCVLSASPVLRERVCLHKRPLHCRALEVWRGPRLRWWLRWGIAHILTSNGTFWFKIWRAIMKAIHFFFFSEWLWCEMRQRSVPM